MTTLADKPKTHPAGSLPRAEPGDLLTALLAESRELTAVERFSAAHDRDEIAQAQYYHDLIPLTQPAAGQQYAFEVDLDACTGCKACVSACHSLNGLEPNETWRSVGLLSGQNGLPILQHVTTACHHCLEPGCLAGCPTNAYEKDPVTGIVRHLDDQCFGCQYCTMTCPYEVPQYSPAKGIVRKCDMCHDRLAQGEAPACVQACPTGAIRISVVDVAQSRARTTRGEFLPASPPADLTHPTTRFKSEHPLPADLRSVSGDELSPQHAHLPLVLMLVLTQMSVGAVIVGSLWRWLGGASVAEYCTTAGVVVGYLGLALAPLHLGRPHLAFRSVLGWRHSWLSREAIAFGVFAVAAGTLVLFTGPKILEDSPPIRYLQLLAEVFAVVWGLLGVFCSARIYQFTNRDFWIGRRTWLKFFGTTVVLGLALAASFAMVVSADTATNESFLVLAMLFALVAKVVYELQFGPIKAEDFNTLRQTAQLLGGPLAFLLRVRLACAFAGGITLAMMLAPSEAGTPARTALAASGLCLLLAGEVLERTLYFRAVVPHRMPGGLRT